MRAATSTTATPPSGEAISCGNAIPSRSPSDGDGALGRALGELELVGVDRRGVEVDPPDPEPDPGRAEPVGQRHEPRVATARDHDAVHLGALDEPLEDRLASRRLDEREVERRLEVAGRVDPEDAALAAGVDRLQDGREPDRLERRAALRQVPHGGEGRLRDPLLGERAAHHELVRHAVGDGAADRRQAEPLGHRGDDRHGAVGGDGEDAVDLLSARDGLDGVDVREVDDLGGVRERETRRVGVAVDRDDAEAAVARLCDRTALVAPGADEEDARHGAMLDGAGRATDYHPRVSLTGKRVLITGGAGFIGTTLARRLVDANEVVAVDNLHRNALAGTELEEHPGFRFVEGDVLDPVRLAELVEGCTHIVHAAGIAGVDTVLQSPVRTMRVNVIGTYNVLEAAATTLDTLERLVEFSTSEVFGQHAFNVQEGHVTSIGSVGEARWTYAVSKLAGEHMAHAYHAELGVPAVSVRPFNIYGPGQIGGGAIRAFIEAALAGGDLEIHGDGSQIRAWCYVDDMVEALMLALEHPAAVGESFNVGNARSAVTIYDLATRIKRLTGCPGEIRFVPLEYTDVELRIPNIEKARTLLGFEARVELDEGLERTIAWYRARLGAPA